MKVKLICYTPEPERVCAAAALTSPGSGGTSEIFESLDLEKARKTLRRIMGYGHVSVIEHANFTFSLEEVSRALTHQLVRHRIASYTQQSQRYVTYDTLKEYVTPPSIADKPEAKQVFDEALENISKTYQKLLEMGIQKEDARYILPNAAKTNIIVTMNARELRHFFNLRCCARTQWELREVATEMLRQVKKVAPSLFENAGPNCVELGFCPEGKLKPPECSIEEIKTRFKNL
jgi:thymidylate synthase (FAD)